MKSHNFPNYNLDNGWDIPGALVFDDEIEQHDIEAQLVEQPTHTSIDTIRFTGPFKIVGHLSPDFTIYHSFEQLNDVCLYVEENDGRPACFIGLLAQASKNGIHACIKPLYTGSSEIMCSVSFSAPNVLYGSNEHILTAEECRQAIDIVQQTLLDWGIEMDVQRAKLTRVDVLRHLEMNRPAICHVHLLHFLTIKHSKYTVNYPNGIRRGNKSTQLSIYAKGKEMERKGRHPSQVVPRSFKHAQLLDNLQHGTILRVEWRLRNSAVIRREFKGDRVSHLLDTLGLLAPWLTENMKSNLFREKLPYDVEDLIDKPPFDRPTAQSRSRFLARKLGGTALAVKQTLLFEAFENRVHTCGVKCMSELRKMHSTSRGSDEFAKFRSEIRKVMLHGLSIDGIPNAVLYEELRRATESSIGSDCTQPAPRPQKARKLPQRPVLHTPRRRR